MNSIEIQLNKTRMKIAIVSSSILILYGIYLMVFVAPYQQTMNMWLMEGITLAVMSIFIFSILYNLKKINIKVGFIINDEGIIDNTASTELGLITWGEMTTIKVESMMTSKVLLIYTRDPQKILERVKGKKGRYVRNNMKIQGTMVAIASKTLVYNFDDLVKEVKDRHKKYLEKHQAQQENV
jgi:hypothetical protein